MRETWEMMTRIMSWGRGASRRTPRPVRLHFPFNVSLFKCLNLPLTPTRDSPAMKIIILSKSGKQLLWLSFTLLLSLFLSFYNRSFTSLVGRNEGEELFKQTLLPLAASSVSVKHEKQKQKPPIKKMKTTLQLYEPQPDSDAQTSAEEDFCFFISFEVQALYKWCV